MRPARRTRTITLQDGFLPDLPIRQSTVERLPDDGTGSRGSRPPSQTDEVFRRRYAAIDINPKDHFPGLPPLQQLLQAAAELHPLADMACLGRVQAVENLIQSGADREKTDCFGKSPLHSAAALGHEAVVQKLARLGAKLENPDLLGRAPLHLAARHGQRQVIQTLIELRADINALSAGGRTALHHAVDGMQAAACGQLLMLKAHAEARDEQKDTPLTLAVRCGHTMVLDTLIDNRCDPHTFDDDGLTPLHLAACKQRLECINVLVARGARPDTSDSWGMMPIHWAARTGESDIVQRLVELDASVNSRDVNRRQTPLHMAAMSEELVAIEVLAKAKANLDSQDNRGYTPVHTAVEYNRQEALKCLLRLGCSMDLQTKSSDTALHLAVQRDQPKLVECLIEHSCNVNSRGRRGQTALHIVSEIGSMQCATPLLDSIARAEYVSRENTSRWVVNPNCEDQQKQRALHVAAWHGRNELCSVLVQNRAEVDPLDMEECTPLSLAVTKDHEATVKVLMRLNADPMRPNQQQLAPLQQACVRGAVLVTQFLVEMKMLPKLDEPPWRRPMALAKFYGNHEIVKFFFKPCPKVRLSLKMVRPIGCTTIAATYTPVISECPITHLKFEAAKRIGPAGVGTKKELALVDSEGNAIDYFKPELVVKEVELQEENWLTGETLQVEGFEEKSRYVVRLVARNDAGVTFGDPVDVETPPDKEKERAQKEARARAAAEAGIQEQMTPSPELGDDADEQTATSSASSSPTEEEGGDPSQRQASEDISESRRGSQSAAAELLGLESRVRPPNRGIHTGPRRTSSTESVEEELDEDVDAIQSRRATLLSEISRRNSQLDFSTQKAEIRSLLETPN